MKPAAASNKRAYRICNNKSGSAPNSWLIFMLKGALLKFTRSASASFSNAASGSVSTASTFGAAASKKACRRLPNAIAVSLCSRFGFVRGRPALQDAPGHTSKRPAFMGSSNFNFVVKRLRHPNLELRIAGFGFLFHCNRVARTRTSQNVPAKTVLHRLKFTGAGDPSAGSVVRDAPSETNHPLA